MSGERVPEDTVGRCYEDTYAEEFGTRLRTRIEEDSQLIVQAVRIGLLAAAKAQCRGCESELPLKPDDHRYHVGDPRSPAWPYYRCQASKILAMLDAEKP